MFRKISVTAIFGVLLLATTATAQEKPKLMCVPMTALVPALREEYNAVVDMIMMDGTITSVVISKTTSDVALIKTIKGKNHPTDSVSCLLELGHVAEAFKDGVNSLALLAWKEKT